MKKTVLLIDYEPRNASRYGAALAPLGVDFLSAADLNTAVSQCSKVEPSVVLISSVLPRVKVDDAITQLRARAGLRSTPFVVLMSGYTGSNPKQDAQVLGAQDILPKPFSDDQLRSCVKTWLEAGGRSPAVSEKTKVEILEALRQQAAEGPVVTSEQLFGDLLGEEEGPGPADTQRIKVEPKAPTFPQAEKKLEPPSKPTASKAATPPPQAAPAPTPPKGGEDAERILEATIAAVLKPGDRPKKVTEDTGAKRAEELLSQTLSGLGVPLKPKAPAPEPAKGAAAEPTPAPGPELARPEVPKTAEPSVPTGTPFGQYELIEHIATGGMAEVYKARMKGLQGFQKIVAIKRILPHLTDNDEFVTMFIDEAKLAAQLQHPNIIHIYDLGKIERSYYIAMEYIDGLDLRTILGKLQAKGMRFPLSLALYVGARLADALDYAHRKRDFKGQAMALVHRDVSPQNVLISYEGEIKLCDFGIAKAASKASHTRAGALKGKLQYMSPEQAWGKDIDYRSDIFSLGLVLYEMILGQKAFSGDSELSILEQVRSPKIVPPRELDPSLPQEVEEILLKALREKREERYQTAADMAKDLEAAIRNQEPAPSAASLSAFLCDLVGRERPSLVTELPPTVKIPTPPPTKPKEEVAPKPEPKSIPAPKVMPPASSIPELSEPLPRREKPSPALWIVPALIVGATAVYFAFFRGKAPSPAETTPQEVPPQVAEVGTPTASGILPPATTEAPIAQAPTPVPTQALLPTPQRTPLPTPTRAPAMVPPPVVPATVPVPTAIPEETPAPTPSPEPIVIPAPTPTPTPQPTVAPTPTPLAVATAREGDLVEIPDVWPEPILTPKPSYPPLAARQKLGGTVILRVLVDETGTVRDVQVLRGVKPDLGLDAAAVAAVKNWRYKPAMKDGVRVKVWYSQSVPFRPQ
ncbi:MAG: TonB family protein [Thermoanaerobaculaceae bacterium]